MLQKAKQDRRHLAVFTPLGNDQLLLRRFTGREQLSGLFQYELEMLSGRNDIPPQEIVGRNITFLVDRQDHGPRYFNGYVSRFSQAATTDLATGYRATVVPWLWFLTRSSDCRIFQYKKTPEIVEQVFQDHGFDDFETSGLRGDYAQREYCVQYRETDFDFVSRLLEEEGIYYYFRHENGRHVLVLADHPSGYFDLDDQNVTFPGMYRTDRLGDRITEWDHQYAFQTSRWAQTDYDFTKPRTNLMSTETGMVPHQGRKGLEIYDYPGRFSQPAVGRALTRVRMEELEVEHDTVRGAGTYRSFAPGGRTTIQHDLSPNESGGTYAITAVEHQASVGGTYITGTGTGAGDEEDVQFQSRFTCIPDSVPFRPARRTPRPVVEGPQTAVVVGPDKEEIHTDQYAQVKVQFHWDRQGSFDENSSCWVRVSQDHAGQGWGAMDSPRIGEEVIVAFLEGDPDRPIIKGRVYNGEVTPPFTLDGANNANNKTRRGGKTDTYKGSGYNEMTMDDTRGKEQLRTNAQYNMDTNVNNNQTLAVGVDRAEDIGNNDDLTIGVDASLEVGNNQATKVGNNENIEVANHVVITAGTSITLACGASTIHMNQAGVITISGQFVTSAATANNATIAPLTQVTGSNMLLQAGLVALDLGGITHVKGKETTVNAATVNAHGSGETLLIGKPLKLGEVGAPIISLPPDQKKDGDQENEDEQPNENVDESNHGDAKTGDQNEEAPEDVQIDKDSFPYDATNFGHKKSAKEMSEPEYREALANTKSHEEAVALAMERNNEDAFRADHDIIGARRDYYDKQKDRIGKPESSMTNEELESLHNPSLVNADQYLEGYKQTQICGEDMARAKIWAYNKYKEKSYDGNATNSTDNDGRAQSPPGMGQVEAAHQGVDRAIKDGKHGSITGECIASSLEETIRVFD